jgi:hypothetical protein
MWNKKLNFIVTNEFSNIRWINYSYFIENIEKISNSNNSNNSIFTLTHSNFDNIIRIIKQIWDNIKDINIDYVIVYSLINQKEINNFQNYLKENWFTKIILIKTIDNLWSAWGYALWLEYIIEENYQNIIFLEDDVEVLDKDSISEILKNIDKKTIVHTLCNNHKESDWSLTKSWHIQFTWYPVDFFKLVWNHDPRYFWRSDDLDFWERIEKIIKNYNYKRIKLNKLHYHPNYKSWTLKMWFIYMVLRNHLFTCSKYWIRRLLEYLPIVFMYIWSSVLQLINNLYFLSIYATLRWIIDFIFINKTFIYNQNIIKSKWASEINNLKKYKVIEIKTEELSNKLKNIYQTYWLYGNDAVLNLNLKNLFLNIFKFWNLTNNYYWPTYPINLLWPKTFIIENIDYYKKICKLIEINNGYLIKRYLNLILSFSITILIMIIFTPLILIKFLIITLKKWNQ